MVDLIKDSIVTIGGVAYDMSDEERAAIVNGLGTMSYTLTFNTAKAGLESPYTVTFTPDDEYNYQTATTDTTVNGEVVQNTIDLEVVAYLNPTVSNVTSVRDDNDIITTVGSCSINLTNPGGIPYGTIKKAVGDTTSGSNAVIWVVPNNTGNVVIEASFEIPSSVALILPYLEGTSAHKSCVEPDGSICYKNTGATLSLSDNNTKCSTKVTLNPGVTLTVKGTLEIAGVIYGGGGGLAYSGQTGGNFASLVLSGSSSLVVESGAIVRVSGYIVDEKDHNPEVVTDDYVQSLVYVKSGGTLYQPIVIRDFKGGTITAQLVAQMLLGRPVSPFYEIAFMNVESLMRIDQGGLVYNYANIAAGNQLNTAIAPLIGNTSSFFIELSQGAHVDVDYDFGTNKLSMHFYGGAKTNRFVVNVKIGSSSESCNSDQFVFPISWIYDITLDVLPGGTSATYNMNSQFKLLPGSKMTVAQGATLEVKELTVYETYNDAINTQPYPTDYSKVENSTLSGAIPGAQLIVNGTVTATKLAGKVYSTNPNGAIVSASTVSYNVREPSNGWFGSISSSNVSHKLILCYGNTTVTAAKNSTYKTVNGVWTKQ